MFWLLEKLLIKSIVRSPEVFCKKGVLSNFAKLVGKHLCQSLFLNKVAGLRNATLWKKSLWRRCFPVNFAKFLRTPVLTKHRRRLPLSSLVSLVWTGTYEFSIYSKDLIRAHASQGVRNVIFFEKFCVCTKWMSPCCYEIS